MQSSENKIIFFLKLSIHWNIKNKNDRKRKKERREGERERKQMIKTEGERRAKMNKE